jgi:hypothetical protein
MCTAFTLVNHAVNEEKLSFGFWNSSRINHFCFIFYDDTVGLEKEKKKKKVKTCRVFFFHLYSDTAVFFLNK